MTSKKKRKPKNPPLSEKRARLIREMHKDGRCVSHIAGACSVIFKEEIHDSRVRLWLQELGLERVVMSDKERLQLAGKASAKKRPPRPDMKKIQPVEYKVQKTPYETALDELKDQGMPTSGSPLQVMKRANALRRQQGKPLFDKCPEWLER